MRRNALHLLHPTRCSGRFSQMRRCIWVSCSSLSWRQLPDGRPRFWGANALMPSAAAVLMAERTATWPMPSISAICSGVLPCLCSLTACLRRSNWASAASFLPSSFSIWERWGLMLIFQYLIAESITALARLAVLVVLSAARRLVSLLF